MHCPSCNHIFSFPSAMRIHNPFRKKCPSCSVLLTMGKTGCAYWSAGALLGGGLAALAIFAETRGIWTPMTSLACFAVALPMGSVGLDWIFWKNAEFRLIAPKVQDGSPDFNRGTRKSSSFRWMDE